MTRYWKAILSVLGGVATWGITAGADDSYSQVELWGLLAAAVASASVWYKANTPPAGQASDPNVSETN